MQAVRPARTVLKRWLFRLAAAMIGLGLLVIAEGLLRATNYGLLSELDDPFVGFDDVHPLFVLDESRERYEVDPARTAYFRPQSFAADKPADEFRIFCLGGSTVQGRPYAVETSFTNWLQLSLDLADPRRRWQVVNCGGISYASYRLQPILRELLEHQPDLFILYTGHNEFLEDRTYREVKGTSPTVATIHGWASRSRLYNLMRMSWLRLAGRQQRPADTLPSEVDALLDYRGGLADYHRDDRWRQDAVEHYRFNLTRMVQQARAAGVPVILVSPVANLRDCPPFKFEHLSGLSGEKRSEFEDVWRRAQDCENLGERRELLEQAVALDERFAAAHYALAKCYDASGLYEQARRSYLRAKDEDICPLRMTESQYEALEEVARSTRSPLVDARGFFTSESRHQIPGNDWLLDHVHPSINGHQEIAALLLDEMVRLDLVRPRPDWESDRAARYTEHLDSLDDAYFVRGRQRLEGLIRWTQGRAEGRGPRRSGGSRQSR